MAGAAGTGTPGMVRGVKVLCNGDRSPAPFVEIDVAENDSVFTGGEASPVFDKLGLKLMAKRIPASKNFPARNKLDNQIATYMMIRTDSGFAPPSWQMQVGNVIFVRKDKKPLTLQQFETMWMFNDNLLDLFGDNAEAAHAMMTRERFDRFWDRYKAGQMAMIREMGDRQDEVDAWLQDENPLRV